MEEKGFSLNGFVLGKPKSSKKGYEIRGPERHTQKRTGKTEATEPYFKGEDDSWT